MDTRADDPTRGMAVIEIDMTGIDGPKYQAIEASMAE
jgi:hypothetical protein